jgi:hypothetical protein
MNVNGKCENCMNELAALNCKLNKAFGKNKQKTTAPADSRIITDYSTEGALASLTLEIERDPVCSSRYGRS